MKERKKEIMHRLDNILIISLLVYLNCIID